MYLFVNSKEPMKLLTILLIILLHIAMSGTAMADEIIINAVGDIMLAGRWTNDFKKRGYDFPFRGTATELATGDINLANLESPIAAGGNEFKEKLFRFRSEPAVAPALRKAGFNLVTLANNHSMDFGPEALFETTRHLASAGIDWIGAGDTLGNARRIALYSIKGKRVAFLGYSLTQPLEFFAGTARPGTAPGYEKLVANDVASARRQADYVIVTIHWGREGSGTIQPYQQRTGRAAIDAGADAVIGHHPHVLQGVERYKNGIIFYSLGNFAFASTSRTADYAAMVRLRLNGSSRRTEVIPLDVLASRVHFQPRILDGARGAKVISQINSLSRPFGTAIENTNGRYSVNF